LAAAGKFASENSNIGYGPSSGDPELIQRRSLFYKNRLHLNIGPENVIVTQGASEALELAIFSVANPGDEIAVVEPFFPNYKAIAEKFSVKLNGILTRIEDGFHITQSGETPRDSLRRIDKVISSKTRAILWSSPSNPTGAVYGKDELELLYTIANKHNLFLIADEVYRLLTFNEGVESNGILRSPSIFDIIPKSDRAMVMGIDSSSKEISLCGGRIGYLIVDESLSPTILKNASVRACPNILSQEAVKEIVNVDPEYFFGNQQELKKRRDFLHQELSGMKHLGVSVSPSPPEGAFYIIADLGKQISAEKFCKWLLTDYPNESGKKETVLLTPMRMNTGGFYLDKNTGGSQIRIAYVRKMDELVRGINTLKLALEIYLNK
jgi:aspartate aminotransferase